MIELEVRVWDRVDQVMYFPVSDLTPYLEKPRFEIMIFTLIRDRYGRKIFELDIMAHVDHKDHKGLVVFNDGCFVLQAEDGTSHLFQKANTFEVVGNKFEHPDLLPKKQA